LSIRHPFIRHSACLLLALALVLIQSIPVHAWSFEAHRFITDRALLAMPAHIRPFFVKHRAMIAEHSIDPDLWRNAGFEEEPPRHYLDLDAYGPYPFDALPRDYDAAVAKFGREMVEKNGLLPWRTEEIYQRLVKTFAEHKEGRPYALENVKFFTAVLAHYASDAHVPLHAVENHDGQLTGQQGVHARFETELFIRYQKRLTLAPVVRVPIQTGARDFIFDTLLESARLAGDVLEADRAAIGEGELYDDAYFARFHAKAGPILQRRVQQSIAAIVSLVTAAWEEGGRPDLPPDPPRRPARRRVLTQQ
jgi:hypothetical protein